MPLKHLRNTSTSSLIDLFENELKRCHNPYSRQPVGITTNTVRKHSPAPRLCTAEPRNLQKLTHPGRCEGLQVEDLRITMECTIALGRKFDTLDKQKKYQLKLPYQPLIRFTPDCIDDSYPEPDLSSIYTDASHRRVGMLILRHPTNGDTGLKFQRYLWPALRLLFAGLNVNITSSVLVLLLKHKSHVVVEIQNTTIKQVPRP